MYPKKNHMFCYKTLSLILILYSRSLTIIYSISRVDGFYSTLKSEKTKNKKTKLIGIKIDKLIYV